MENSQENKQAAQHQDNRIPLDFNIDTEEDTRATDIALANVTINLEKCSDSKQSDQEKKDEVTGGENLQTEESKMDLDELLAEREKSDSIRKKFSVNNAAQFFEGCGESPEYRPEAMPQLNKARSQLYDKKNSAVAGDKCDSDSVLSSVQQSYNDIQSPSSINDPFLTPPGQNMGRTKQALSAVAEEKYYRKVDGRPDFDAIIKNDPNGQLRDTGPHRSSQHVSKSSTKNPLAPGEMKALQKHHSIEVSKAQNDDYQQKQQIKRDLKFQEAPDTHSAAIGLPKEQVHAKQVLSLKSDKRKDPRVKKLMSGEQSHKSNQTDGSKKNDHKNMRNILQEFNNSSTSLFKIPKNLGSQTANPDYNVASGKLALGMVSKEGSKQSFKRAGLSLDDLRKKQKRIEKNKNHPSKEKKAKVSDKSLTAEAETVPAQKTKKEGQKSLWSKVFGDKKKNSSESVHDLEGSDHSRPSSTTQSKTEEEKRNQYEVKVENTDNYDEFDRDKVFQKNLKTIHSVSEGSDEDRSSQGNPENIQKSRERRHQEERDMDNSLSQRHKIQFPLAPPGKTLAGDMIEEDPMMSKLEPKMSFVGGIGRTMSSASIALRSSDIRQSMMSSTTGQPRNGQSVEDMVYKSKDLSKKLQSYYEIDEKIQKVTEKLKTDENLLAKKPEDKNSMKSKEKNLKTLRELKDKQRKHVDTDKLRLTTLSGIPCTFVNFVKSTLNQHGDTERSDADKKTIYITEISKTSPNMRRQVWMINCKVPELKERVLAERQEVRQQWLDTESSKGKTMEELVKEWPPMETADDLFQYYMTKDSGPDMFEELKKDVPRANLGNTDWMKECSFNGNNSLFNVLNAYANYDTEILYSQGMNIVVSWILKFMRLYNSKTKEIQYDEQNTFFILLHIMEDLQYRHVYDIELSKTREHLLLIQEILEGSFEEFYNHLLDEADVDLAPYFTNIIMTMFVANLQDCHPEIAVKIFDAFLIDGESVIFMLLMKFITLKEQTLLNLWDNDLMKYLKEDLPKECLTEYKMTDLLDFDAQIENQMSSSTNLCA